LAQDQRDISQEPRQHQLHLTGALPANDANSHRSKAKAFEIRRTEEVTGNAAQVAETAAMENR